MYCPGGKDENGCYLPNQCISESCGGCPPLYGNSTCDQWEYTALCQGPDSEECPYSEICAHSPHGQTCDVDVCPVYCGANEVKCEGKSEYASSQECPEYKDYCMEAYDSDGCMNFCPNWNKCPDNNSNFTECPGGTDFNGCNVPRGKNYFKTAKYSHLHIICCILNIFEKN